MAASALLLLVLPLTTATKTHEELVAAQKLMTAKCDCSCCEAPLSRTASLRKALGAMCEPVVIRSRQCPAECQDRVATDDIVASPSSFLSSEYEGLLDYQRFCLDSCKPNAALKKKGSQTIPCSLPAVSAGDSALDGSSQLLSQGAHRKEEEEEKSKPDKETAALITNAEGKKAAAMAVEAKAAATEAAAAAARAQSEADVALAQNRGSLSEEIKAELRESAQRAAVFAKSAADAAAKAQEELKELEAVPEMAAKEAAAAAVDQLKKQTAMNQQVMDILAQNVNRPPLPPVSESALKAAEPYNKAMNQAAQIESLYEAKAGQLNYEAELLRAGAKQVESQVAPYEAAGRHDLANAVKANSEKLLLRSMAKNTQASETLHEVDKIEETIPKYAEAASTAVKRAAILSAQKWMPPPLLVDGSAPAAAGSAPAAAGAAPA